MGNRATLATDDPILAGFASEVGAEDAVAIEGARTRWRLGGDVSDQARVVRAPAGVVEYVPEEMTVTVRAGTSVAELHAELAASGQRTALPERGGTVGGAVAVGENDPRSLGRGMLRTSVLQVRYVSAEGRLVAGGGPTVKNVSGFDLPRLMVGSLGTLGFLAELILRTNPVPSVSVWFRSDDAEPESVYQQAMSPSAVLWDGETTWVQLEGHQPDVAAQASSLGEVGTFDELGTLAALPVELPPHRWSLPPGELSTLRSANSPVGETFVAAYGLGLVFADRPQPQRSLAAPLVAVSERLKQQFDPTGRLNPGRSPIGA